ncbi:uncharacterized protein [Macrobrachium rosenbergii]|uniref:uncharacterized protein isoform X1 n=1 Tax=Macrobrachium rosenbergii TaxID=79674 RepID=UPI0034D5366E
MRMGGFCSRSASHAVVNCENWTLSAPMPAQSLPYPRPAPGKGGTAQMSHRPIFLDQGRRIAPVGMTPPTTGKIRPTSVENNNAWASGFCYSRPSSDRRPPHKCISCPDEGAIVGQTPNGSISVISCRTLSEGGAGSPRAIERQVNNCPRTKEGWKDMMEVEGGLQDWSNHVAASRTSPGRNCTGSHRLSCCEVGAVSPVISDVENLGNCLHTQVAEMKRPFTCSPSFAYRGGSCKNGRYRKTKDAECEGIDNDISPADEFTVLGSLNRLASASSAPPCGINHYRCHIANSLNQRDNSDVANSGKENRHSRKEKGRCAGKEVGPTSVCTSSPKTTDFTTLGKELVGNRPGINSASCDRTRNSRKTLRLRGDRPADDDNIICLENTFRQNYLSAEDPPWSAPPCVIRRFGEFSVKGGYGVVDIPLYIKEYFTEDLLYNNPQGHQHFHVGEPPPKLLKLLLRKDINTLDFLRTIQDPASQRLTWYKPPLSVLVIKKVRDAQVIQPFIQLVKWLTLEKRMLVFVEASVLEDPLVTNHSGFPSLKDKLMSFREGQDDLTDRIDFIICLGGDGTLLYASSLFQQSVPPVMAFHLGSLGFLTPFKFDNFQDQVTHVLEGHAALTLRSRLRCIILRKEQETGKNSCPPTNLLVLNEVVIDRGPSPYLSNIDLYLDGKRITSVQGDGLIVSTPTGSTAYAVAAGASMIHPSVPAIMVTPICPHSLSFRPIVVPAGVELKIAVSRDSRNTAWVSFDGRKRQELLHGDSLRVTTSIYPVPSICAEDQIADWFASLDECLRWNDRKRQKHFDEPEDLSSPDLTHSSSSDTLDSLSERNEGCDS